MGELHSPPNKPLSSYSGQFQGMRAKKSLSGKLSRGSQEPPPLFFLPGLGSPCQYLGLCPGKTAAEIPILEMGLDSIQLREPLPPPKKCGFVCVCSILSSNSRFYVIMLPSPPGDLGMTSLPERKWWMHLDASLTQLRVAQVLLEILGIGGPHAFALSWEAWARGYWRAVGLGQRTMMAMPAHTFVLPPTNQNWRKVARSSWAKIDV